MQLPAQSHGHGQRRRLAVMLILSSELQPDFSVKRQADSERIASSYEIIISGSEPLLSLCISGKQVNVMWRCGDFFDRCGSYRRT